MRSMSNRGNVIRRAMEKEKIAEILDKHEKWLRGEDGGEQANFTGENLARGESAFMRICATLS